MSVNKVENWLFFRTVADADNDDGDSSTANQNPTTICVPASKVIHMEPNADTGLQIHWSPVKHPEDPNTHKVGYNHDNTSHDGVKLDVDQGRTADVMKTIGQAINSYINKDGFIVVADDMTTDVDNNTVDAEYLSPYISSCGNILAPYSSRHRGIHEYFEVITPMTADDDDVAASLSIKIPSPSIILEASLISVARASNDVGSVALEYHNAAVADDDASAGTELVGADASGNTSIPDGDLDISSNATFPALVHSGSAAKVSRTADTFLHVTAKEDCSSMTGTPQVGVYVKWFGLPAVLV